MIEGCRLSCCCCCSASNLSDLFPLFFVSATFFSLPPVLPLLEVVLCLLVFVFTSNSVESNFILRFLGAAGKASCTKMAHTERAHSEILPALVLWVI